MSSRGRGRGTGIGNRAGARSNSNASVRKSVVVRGSKKQSNKTKRGRAKVELDPPNILELKARKAELATFFKAVGSSQKTALLNLAQKSLEFVAKDSNYHEKLPEFDKLTRDIDEQLKCILSKLEARRCYEQELAQHLSEQNVYLINQQCKNKLEDIKEENIAKVQERILYVEHMRQVGGQVEDVAFKRGEDGRKVTRLPPSAKIVHPVAIPFSRGQLADGVCANKPGDNLLEQHPANFWESLSDAQKKAITLQHDSIIQANTKKSQDEKLGIFQKHSATTSRLFNPSAVPGMVMDVDEDDIQLDDQALNTDTAAHDEQNQVTDFSDDAAEMPLDQYGVRIPKRKFRATSKVRPNNHMVVPPAFHFEDAEGQILEDGSVGIQEIGFRSWTTKNIRNRDYFIGSDTSPNPKYFFLPQRVGDINSGNNTIEDMRHVAHIAHTHKLHPLLGIVLPGSINPDYYEIKDPYFPPPSDRTKPLELYKPHLIIQDNSDGTKTVSRAQRSWIRGTKEKFEDNGVKKKVRALLKASGDYTVPEGYPSSVYQENEVIDKDLIGAVMAAIEENDHSSHIDSVIRSDAIIPPEPHWSPKPIPPPNIDSTSNIGSPPVPTKLHFRQSCNQYDPVRDSFQLSTSQIFPTQSSTALLYQTPYSQTSPQMLQPNIKSISMMGGKNKLEELANYALSVLEKPVLSMTSQPITSSCSAVSTTIPVFSTTATQGQQKILTPQFNSMQSQIYLANLPLQKHGKLSPVSPTQSFSLHGSQNRVQQCPPNSSISSPAGYSIIMNATQASPSTSGTHLSPSSHTNYNSHPPPPQTTSYNLHTSPLSATNYNSHSLPPANTNYISHPPPPPPANINYTSHPPPQPPANTNYTSHPPPQPPANTNYTSHPPPQPPSNTNYNSHIPHQSNIDYNSHSAPSSNVKYNSLAALQSTTTYSSHPYPPQNTNYNSRPPPQPSIDYNSHPPSSLNLNYNSIATLQPAINYNLHPQTSSSVNYSPHIALQPSTNYNLRPTPSPSTKYTSHPALPPNTNYSSPQHQPSSLNANYTPHHPPQAAYTSQKSLHINPNHAPLNSHSHRELRPANTEKISPPESLPAYSWRNSGSYYAQLNP
ncbi:BgTH12-03856 [Blumeria graminis f. sp. triticale]|uniref:BgTH12-03856 n=1 Tax=Blumeria graminis f. sp. triticale TaxID=1689686 RepID=A0A9W4GCU7_BLUGR|nr:BgTH12-03856 [Blumeria graminis f. sp. triticale]